MHLDLLGSPLDEAGLLRLQTLLSGGRSSPAAEHLIAHARSLGACFTITEKPYTDQDYSADFLSFYAAAFKTYPRFTERVHFFSKDVGDLFGEPFAEQISKLTRHSAYLGFVVVRPIAQGPIGRSVLGFPKFGDDLIVRPAARARFKVHLYGAELEVEGAPFIQQDTRVGACAQAAIWMANRPLHERHGRCGLHPISDITRLATTPTDSDLSKSLPAGSSGLSPLHITRALRAMGHQPYCDIFLSDDSEPAKSALPQHANDKSVMAVSTKPSAIPSVIRYLDSGLPVILGMSGLGGDQDGHAITAVGYVETKGEMIRATHTYDGFVRAIIVHDDQRGPYRLLPLTLEDIPFLPHDRLLKVNGEPICLDAAVTHIFVPLSPRVFLIADHADIVARDFVGEYVARLAPTLEDMLADEAPNARIAMQEFVDAEKSGRLVRRTYLTTAGRYRHHLAKSDLTEEVKIEAITRILPHFVWITELLYRDSFQEIDGGARRVVGHLVMNATSSTDQNSDLLFAHFPHAAIHRDVDPPAGTAEPYVESAKLFSEYAPYAQRLRA